jgi:hypothetical protein
MNLKIFTSQEGVLRVFDEIRIFTWRLGDAYLLKLEGVEIVAKDRVEVIPAYMPFLSVENRAGQLLIDFNFWTDSTWRFIFQKRSPYFIYRKIGNHNYEEDEDEDTVPDNS